MTPSDDPSLNEAQTRKQKIDPKLTAAGWQVLPYDSRRPVSSFNNCAVEEYPTDNGPADYALVAEGRVVGVVEGKKLSIGPQNVLTQAERYSMGLADSSFDFRGYRVPFLYSTNGEVIWYHDIRHPLRRSRRIARFHAPSALAEFLDKSFEGNCERLRRTPNDHPRLRPYQIETNAATERAIADHKRHMLLAMATGTGKTFTMVNQVYRLMKSGLAKRILFLVDRRALAAQAVRAFASFEPEPGHKFDKTYEVYSQAFRREDFGEEDKFDPKVLPSSYLLDPKPTHAFVYVCTIQRMVINLFGRESMFRPGDEEPEDDEAGELDIPIHAFDVVVADECHRGYTAAELSVWRNTLEHFDAIKIGLTATPAAHTMTYFKELAYRYGYSRAVEEGYLVDYDPVLVHSDIRMNGMFLKEGDQVGVVNPQTGAERMDLLEDEREIETADIERRATSPDSNTKILEELKNYALEHEDKCGRFPKTLIFAVNDLPHTSHSDALVDLARDVFGRGDSFVQKITGRVDRPLQRIREFRNRKLPGIVVTVDMLSTGVDIPDLEFIVFLRTVKSRILFEQMMGRGTRRGENFPDKSHFTVFDCFGGSLLEYFGGVTGITAEAPLKITRTIPEIIEDIWQNRDRDYNTRALAKRLQRIAKEMSGEAVDLFAEFIPDGDLSRFAKELPRKVKEEFTDTMQTLRNKDFQDLLANYPRANRTFWIAYDAEDTVTSEKVIRTLDGREYKLEDYLSAFERYVRENPDRIDAISILLSRPQGWGTEALKELREKLSAAAEHFTMDNLQKAHQIRYQKSLVEIISMVKHAAREEEPLYTAEERVSRAFARVTAGKSFTEDQRKWLHRIRMHLVENLSVDREDFDLLPVFSRHGGWGRANRTFDGQLADVIREFNEVVAA